MAGFEVVQVTMLIDRPTIFIWEGYILACTGFGGRVPFIVDDELFGYTYGVNFSDFYILEV